MKFKVRYLDEDGQFCDAISVDNKHSTATEAMQEILQYGLHLILENGALKVLAPNRLIGVFQA